MTTNLATGLVKKVNQQHREVRLGSFSSRLAQKIRPGEEAKLKQSRTVQDVPISSL